MPISDAQVHIWDEATPSFDGEQTPSDRFFAASELPLSAAAIVALMDEAGVDRAVLIPPSRDAGRVEVALAAAARFPGRFAVVAAVDPARTTEADLGEFAGIPALLGVRAALSSRPGAGPALDDGDLDGFFAAVESIGLPLMLSAPGHSGAIGRVARRFPGLVMILDHLNVKVAARDPATRYRGFVDSLESFYPLGDIPNVVAKISVLPRYARDGSPFASLRPHIQQVVRTFGADRCMWGSDLTQLPCPYGEWVDSMLETLEGFASSERDAVMHETLARVLRWP